MLHATVLIRTIREIRVLTRRTRTRETRISRIRTERKYLTEVKCSPHGSRGGDGVDDHLPTGLNGLLIAAGGVSNLNVQVPRFIVRRDHADGHRILFARIDRVVGIQIAL